jgi:hypothetical protein
MVKGKDGLWNIYVGSEVCFESLEKSEAFSALFTVADHWDGIARYNNGFS